MTVSSRLIPPVARSPRWIRALAVTLLFGACLHSPATVQAISDQDFDSAVVDLADENFGKREAASQKLREAASSTQAGTALTAAQVGRLRDATGGAVDAERNRRVKFILETWLGTAVTQAVTPLLDRVRLTEVIDNDYTFTIGKFFTGQIVGGRHADMITVRMQLKKATEVLMGANLNGLQQCLEKARAKFEEVADGGMAEKEFGKLNLKMGNAGATRDQVRAKLTEAINLIAQAEQDIKAASNNATPPPKGRPRAVAPGDQGMGKSLRLHLAALVHEGELGNFSSTEPLAVSAPPAGYEFVGHLYDLYALDSLEVSGSVTVGIEYGETQLIGRPARNLQDLRMVRIANSRATLLPGYVNDTNLHVLTASYVPETPASLEDQFGLFAVVQPTSQVPVAPPLALGVLALLLASLGILSLGIELRSGAAADEGSREMIRSA